jgi:CRISPR-associated endonuclease/helicase Cas3
MLNDDSPPDAVERLTALWAKLPRGSDGEGGYHPLLAHMVDVAQVAATMWRDVLPGPAARVIAAELGLDPTVTGGWVALWAGTHDLGKASPAFARQNSAAWERIREAGFSCPAVPPVRKVPHGVVTAWALPSILAEQLGLPMPLARRRPHARGGEPAYPLRSTSRRPAVTNGT